MDMETFQRVLSRTGYHGTDAETIAIVESDGPARRRFTGAAHTAVEKLAMIDMLIQMGFRYTWIKPSMHPKFEGFLQPTIRSILVEVQNLIGPKAMARTSG